MKTDPFRTLLLASCLEVIEGYISGEAKMSRDDAQRLIAWAGCLERAAAQLNSYFHEHILGANAPSSPAPELPICPRDGETLEAFTSRRLRREMEGLVGEATDVWNESDRIWQKAG